MFLIETAGNTKKTEIKWVFRNATLEWPNKKPGESLLSPAAHAEGDEDVKWCIRLFPNGEEKKHKGYISAYLVLKSSPESRPNLAVKFSFTIFDEEGKKFLVAGGPFEAQPTFTSGQSFGWAELIDLAVVLKSKTFFLTCKLEYGDPKLITTTSVVTSLPSLLGQEDSNQSVNKDLEQLLDNGLETDVCFVVGGKEIKAHKTILLARSPVLAALLKSGMKETVTNRVEIQDIAADIFEALLRSIYTDQVDLTKIDTKELLAAADKYFLPLLKFKCQYFLSERITTKNYVEMLLLADLHNAVYLKKSTLKFIRTHRTSIMQTECWENFKQSRPDLAVTVLENFL